jgi:hypothetical protein
VSSSERWYSTSRTEWPTRANDPYPKRDDYIPEACMEMQTRKDIYEAMTSTPSVGFDPVRTFLYVNCNNSKA